METVVQKHFYLSDIILNIKQNDLKFELNFGTSVIDWISAI